MRSPALAITWQLWWQHRWGLTATGAYVVLVVLLVQTGVAEVSSTRFGTAADVANFSLFLGAVSMLPLLVALPFLLGFFSHGFEADLTAPGSCYPARMFTLPVPTRTLVLWPMLSGAVTLGLGWVAVALWILWPCGLPVPLGWPAFLATAFLTWEQAILWWPFGLRSHRLLVTAVAMILLVAGVHAAGAGEIDPTLLAFLLAGWTGVGVLVAFTGVARARRGEVPDWQWWLRTLRRLDQWLPRRRQPFASAMGAQIWFEWRRHGLALPFLVPAVLPMLWVPLWLGENDVLSLWKALLFALLIPPFAASMAGTTLSESHPKARDYYGLPPFTAGRPMTCGALIEAKLEMAALSTLTAWGVVALLVACVLVFSGNLGVVAGWWDAALQQVPAWKAAGLLALALAGLILLTWKQFVENLLIGLTGHAWVINGFIVGVTTSFVVSSLVGLWIYHHPEYHEPLLRAVPWVMAAAAGLKLAAAGWAVRALHRRRLLSPITLGRLLALWSLSVLGLIALLTWLLPAPVLSVFYVVFGVVLFVPLARLLAAPLALAWNRHR